MQIQNNVKWLTQPNRIEDMIEDKLPDISLITGSFVFAFKGDEILLAQVYSRGWDIPGGHVERGESPEEAVIRELFEETGSSPLLMGLLGSRRMILEMDKPPVPYNYPFPESYMACYWAVIDEVGQPSSSMEVGEPKLFNPRQAKKLDTIKHHKFFYDAALERALVVSGQLAAHVG